MHFTPPDTLCALCPRLADFRCNNQASYPGYYNGAVTSFGELDAPLLIVGLAPGLHGANQTSRPFTGDYAGEVLYTALKKYDFASGVYDPNNVAHAVRQGDGRASNKPEADGFMLHGCRITNAVRCVPPENKPDTTEIRTCNRFLSQEIAAMPNLQVILSLGLISHKAVLLALEKKQSAYSFAHGAEHRLDTGERAILLVDSYHCSRYNINTGVLTQDMFEALIVRVRAVTTTAEEDDCIA